MYMYIYPLRCVRRKSFTAGPLGGLTRLTDLNLDTNSLTGPIPASFCSLMSRIFLHVDSNPGLTCYPSCLASYSTFMSNKDSSFSAVCPSGTPT